MKPFCVLLLLVFPLTALAIPPDEYLFLELKKDVDNELIHKSGGTGVSITFADPGGVYHFKDRRLVYDWHELFNPFQTPFDLNRLQAIIGHHPTSLYPVHNIPTTFQIWRGVPNLKYVSDDELHPNLDTFRLVRIEDSGVAELEFAGEKFTLASGESKEITRKLVYIPRDDITDADSQKRYADVAVAIYTIKDTITNYGFAKKQHFIQYIQPTISGNRLAYVSNRYGEGDIFIYNLTTETEKRITPEEADPWCPKLSGDWLLWYDRRHADSERGVWWDIYAYNLVKEREVRVTEKPAGWIPHLVIDGDWVAYTTEHVLPQKGDRYEDHIPPMAYITLKNLRTDEKRELTDSAHLEFSIFFKDGDLIWEGDDRVTPGYYAYNPATKQQRHFSWEFSGTAETT